MWGWLALRFGRTLGELADALTEEEIEFWREWNLRYPLDDMNRIYRPAALIVSAGAGKGAADAFNRALDVLAPKPKAPARKLRAARIVHHKE